MKRYVLFNSRTFKILGRFDDLGHAIQRMMMKAEHITIQFEVDDLKAYGVSSEEEWKVCKLLGMTTDHVGMGR